MLMILFLLSKMKLFSYKIAINSLLSATHHYRKMTIKEFRGSIHKNYYRGIGFTKKKDDNSRKRQKKKIYYHLQTINVLIKDFGTFMYDHTLHRGRKHIHRYCLQAFSIEEIFNVTSKIVLKLMIGKALRCLKKVNTLK